MRFMELFEDVRSTIIARTNVYYVYDTLWHYQRQVAFINIYDMKL